MTFGSTEHPPSRGVLFESSPAHPYTSLQVLQEDVAGTVNGLRKEAIDQCQDAAAHVCSLERLPSQL